MSAKENVQLMHRWFDEVWNQGKAETVHELLAEDAIGMGQGEPDVKVRFGHSCERQAGPNHRNDDGSHWQRPDRGRLGQLGPTRDDAADRSLWTTRGCTAEEDCVVTSF